MTDPDLPTLAARLAWARKRSGLSALALSREAGLKAGGHVGLIECGEIEQPQANTLAAIALVLGVSLDWLQTGSGTLGPVARGIDTARVNRAVAKASATTGEHTIADDSAAVPGERPSLTGTAG